MESKLEGQWEGGGEEVVGEGGVGGVMGAGNR